MFECVVEILEELNPSSLSSSDLLGLTEVLEVFVVGEDADLVFSSEEQSATALESKDDPCEFFIMHIVVLFRGEEASGVEGDGVHPILVLLGDDDSQGVPRCVGMHDKRLIPIRSLEDQFLGADVLQMAAGRLAAIGPGPLVGFAREAIA